VTWLLDGSEPGVDLVLIQTSLFLLPVKQVVPTLTKVHLHDKRRKVWMKARLNPASLPCKGQVTEQTPVKWSMTQYLNI